ncbi:MAG: aminomethyl-transferring glycine dehydrogenase subunit GcvPB [Deltaproteobacteria bacterium]|nr:aminomethyl-transferring glycine dehydrogenase subunit GcvPB [Deltaproteobacteria bacterium]
MTLQSQAKKGFLFDEPVLFERSAEGRKGFSLPELDVPEVKHHDLFSEKYFRKDTPLLPELSELDVVRHFTRLSQWNYSIDTGFYPLGSCTMKYNPKVNEEAARMSGFVKAHPYQPESSLQGALQVMFELQEYLAEMSGMDAVTLQPAAGAHGEFAGLLAIKAYHTQKGNPRKKILIPDTAHGTNPASSAICNYQVIEIKSRETGVLTPEAVAAVMDEDVAALMLTNPNTLGLFEKHIEEISKIVHAKGGLVYCDGANQNALVGQARVGDMGVDVLHFNLHKTFTTPHGGGGPGAGPVGVKKILEPFLPIPRIVKKDSIFALDYDQPLSVGRVRAFYGNFGMLLRAYTYIREMGPEGLKQVSEMAVLNANYVKARLKPYYQLAYDQVCMHECVFSDKKQQAQGVKTMDIAKRLMDYGFHPPTVYFPLVVTGALMIEPTETESVETIDQFCEAMISIANECQTNPDLVRSAPHVTHVSRLDEVRAVKEPRLTWSPVLPEEVVEEKQEKLL